MTDTHVLTCFADSWLWGFAKDGQLWDDDEHDAAYDESATCISSSRNQTYIRALIVNFQVMLFHEHTDTEVHKMFKENITIINEESGEASFAALSRLITNSTKKNQLDYMSKMYKLLPLYRQIMQDVQMDVKAPLCSRRTITGIRDDDPHVKATRAFLSTFIHEARHNQLSVNPLTQSSVKSLARALL